MKKKGEKFYFAAMRKAYNQYDLHRPDYGVAESRALSLGYLLGCADSLVELRGKDLAKIRQRIIDRAWDEFGPIRPNRQKELDADAAHSAKIASAADSPEEAQAILDHAAKLSC